MTTLDPVLATDTSASDSPVVTPPVDPDAIDEATELRPSDLVTFRAQLIAERQRVLANFSDHVGTARSEQEALVDELDLAARAQDQAFLLRIADKERKLLMEIDRALGKLDEGTYGLCEGTSEPIGLPRLRVRPWARHSVAYKEILERSRR